MRGMSRSVRARILCDEPFELSLVVWIFFQSVDQFKAIGEAQCHQLKLPALPATALDFFTASERPSDNDIRGFLEAATNRHLVFICLL